MNPLLSMLLAWIERAIAILEAARVPAPPANQAERVGNLFSYLSAPAPASTIPPKNAHRLKQKLEDQFAASSDTVLQVMTKTQSELESVFYAAYRNLAYRAPSVEEPQEPGNLGLVAESTDSHPTPKIYALRLKASLFGGSAPRQPKYQPSLIDDPDSEEDPPPRIENPEGGNPVPWDQWDRWTISGDEAINVVFLDAVYDNVQPGTESYESYVVIQNQTGSGLFAEPQGIKIRTIENVAHESRAAYGISGKTTKITLSDSWRTDPPDPDNTNGTNQWEPILRGTVVYAQSEELPLALEPIHEKIQGKEIELAELYNGLEAGRWLIVSGERTDIPDVTGVRGTELVMLARTQQIDPTSADDRTYSKLILDNPLRYIYARDTVTIQGNVVKATHGGTQNEIPGSGDASQALQSFTLKQSRLTYIPAANPRGAESTLHVWVNDVEWHEAENLLAPTERKFITRTSDDDKTTVVFGTRLPTGIENVKAVYRTGIGKAGNVKAEQISMLATRQLWVKEVINPLRASGGAPRESRDQARRNAPLAVLALDRLVSTQDYADFARTLAGIGKAIAALLSDGRRQLVHVTIAGEDDIPIDKSSDLYRNLVKALHEFGDPYQPIQVEMRELMLIVISANVRILPDYLWESVVTKIRTKLLDTFSFERRELGQDVLLSEVIAAIQSVEGVMYADVDTLGGIPEKKADENNPGERRLLTPAEIAEKVTELLVDDRGNPIEEPLSWLSVNLASHENNAIRPAQLAFLSPDVEATLILNEVTL